MFEHCQRPNGRCADVAGKLAQIFGWRHKYEVQRVQSLNHVPPSKSVVITQAVPRRYSADSWVAVHSLQSQSDGGILDPDDRLNDVADDREQIIANYEDGEGQVHHGGDGASGSSVGTGSPDIFQGSEKFRTDIEVTNEQIASGNPAPLQVRRGSEPALNQLLPTTGASNGHLVGIPAVPDTSKRWSAAPIIIEPKERQPHSRKYSQDERGLSNGYSGDSRWHTHEEEDEPQHRLSTAFSRDGYNRLSMQYLSDSPGALRWADAADRVLNNRVQSLSLPREHRRKEPLGQATTSPTDSRNENTEYIVLDTESGALGIHVVPDYDSLGKDRGLLVQGIEPGGRVDRDGRLAVYDRIVEINGRNLLDQPFHVVQDIFRESLRSPELRLRVVKHKTGVKKPPPPVYPKPTNLAAQSPGEKDSITMVEGEERSVSASTKVATVSPTKKLPSSQPGTNTLQMANTRKIGRKMELELVKGPHGLGFSITTRDNPAGGNCPIYIKNILPKGAAVEDGRLRPGDRLLAVDGVELTGKSQSEAVAVLRNAPPGGKVRIVVSRQEDTGSTSRSSMEAGPDSALGSNQTAASNKLQQQQQEKDSKSASHSQATSTSGGQLQSDDGNVYPWKQREILTFDIPVHDSEKAGLGVSVKGKTSAGLNASQNNSSSVSSIDLGIFIKSVIHGGAASRDGRLRTNDQLLNVNGISLLGLSNSAAMETLRKAMLRTDGPVEGCITLTVARRAPELTPPGHQRRDSVSSLLTDSSANTETFGAPSRDTADAYQTENNSGASENSDNTVIFLPPYKHHNHLDGVVMRNPVLERLTGQTSSTAPSSSLRNESYYRATHQTTLMLSGNSKMNSPTVNQPSNETVIIEEDSPYIPVTGRRVEVDKGSNGQQRGSTSSTHTGDVTYASQLSLDEVAAGFSRDAFGRQSMSEKRHATLDAKNTDTYQRNKKIREEREKQKYEELVNEGKFPLRDGTSGLIRVNSAESIPRSESNADAVSKHQLGPSLGMKKSSSLESLQTMVQEIQMQEDNAGTYRNTQGAVRVIRGRGCNESFRAAVDRSYEAPLSLHELRMDTLAEDEGECALGPRQSSLNTAMDCKLVKANKKKQGLLKGIGSMFRFGKHRKSMEGGPSSLTSGGSGGTGSGEEDEREAARRAAREEQERIQEQYRRLLQRQAEMQQQSREAAADNNYMGGGGGMNKEPSRTEKIQQLRAQHQRRHLERRGHYPLDEKEERYEEAIRQRLEQPDFDPGVINRPGSRVGISDPGRFSHYVNYQEIQQHLNRRQQHYHSQRRDNRELSHRPVSNFYEYESVQAVLRGQTMDTNCNSLPRRSEIAPTHGMSSGNSIMSGYGQSTVTRLYQPYINNHPSYMNNNNNNNHKIHHQQQQQYHHQLQQSDHQRNNSIGMPVSSSQRKPHGPFVTHVTIREQSGEPKV